MSKYIRVNGKVYRAVDKVALFDARKIKEQVGQLVSLLSATNWQGLDEYEYEEYYGDDPKAMSQVRSMIAKMEAGQQKIRNAIKQLQGAVGDYAKLEMDYERFKRKYE